MWGFHVCLHFGRHEKRNSNEESYVGMGGMKKKIEREIYTYLTFVSGWKLEDKRKIVGRQGLLEVSKG